MRCVAVWSQHGEVAAVGHRAAAEPGELAAERRGQRVRAAGAALVNKRARGAARAARVDREEHVGAAVPRLVDPLAQRQVQVAVAGEPRAAEVSRDRPRERERHVLLGSAGGSARPIGAGAAGRLVTAMPGIEEHDWVAATRHGVGEKHARCQRPPAPHAGRAPVAWRAGQSP
jgi:hypothetical protein